MLIKIPLLKTAKNAHQAATEGQENNIHRLNNPVNPVIL
jgi:hypothetical protein